MLRDLRSQGAQIAIFGDIDLQAHRDWEEKVCAAAGLTAYLPLWHEPRDLIAQEVLRERFEAYVVCTDSRYLADEFCGRRYDAQFLKDLPPGVDAWPSSKASKPRSTVTNSTHDIRVTRGPFKWLRKKSDSAMTPGRECSGA